MRVYICSAHIPFDTSDLRTDSFFFPAFEVVIKCKSVYDKGCAVGASAICDHIGIVC